MSKIENRRLVIACGGTGGHLFPGIAVAEAWTKAGGEVLLLISEKQIDALASEGYDHLRFEKMPLIAMPRIASLKMPGFVIRFFKSLVACRKLLRSFGADAVLGMGGFTSTAPLIAGRMLKLPTFIHESNSIPGRANVLNAKFAHTILVGFEVCAPRFGAGNRTKVVGTPLRPSVANRPERSAAESYFGLKPDGQTVMVMGGSQGARRLNELVAAGLPEFEKAGISILHISGPVDYETVKPAYEASPNAGVLKDFCADIQNAYAAADLAICRSGASTLTELAFYEIPSVLVPYPFSADDHQITNAEIFSKPGAAELWLQEDLNEENFAGKIIELCSNSDRLEAMKEGMKRLAIPDASERVCNEVVASLQGIPAD
tara:strand:+ start:635 stop:1756 length:1122 start_codon:yes stop_codon:yes gene_type:complete